jgi:hypothetical protein
MVVYIDGCGCVDIWCKIDVNTPLLVCVRSVLPGHGTVLFVTTCRPCHLSKDPSCRSRTLSHAGPDFLS